MGFYDTIWAFSFHLWTLVLQEAEIIDDIFMSSSSFIISRGFINNWCSILTFLLPETLKMIPLFLENSEQVPGYGYHRPKKLIKGKERRGRESISLIVRGWILQNLVLETGQWTIFAHGGKLFVNIWLTWKKDTL